MRIVALGLRGFPDVQGGVETHCEQLYTRIAAQGHEVIVICRKPYMKWTETDFKGVRLIPIDCPRTKSLEAIVHTFAGILRARTLRPDVLHIHAIGPALMVPLARLLGMRVVMTNHGPDYARQKWRLPAKVALRAGESLGSRFSNGIIAISKPIADHVRAAFGRDPMVIPNGVVITSPAQATDAVVVLGLRPGRYILAVGRLVPEKGLHDLIDAFARSKLDGWKLVIVGRADHDDTYSQSLTKQASATADVVMAGFVSGEPLRQLYSHAGLFVLPSYHEGLPIALLEAMSFGLCVLASSIPANREVGLPESQLFPAGKIDMLKGKLCQFAARTMSPEQKKRQIESIALHFNWAAVTNQTIGIYESTRSK